MDLGLKGKTAIITAASRGLGRAAAAALAAEGARIAICSRSEEIHRTAESLRKAHGTDVLSHQVDLRHADEIEAFVRASQHELGGAEIVIANSGGPPPGAFLSLSPQDWQDAFQLTVMSSVHLCYAALPVMLEAGGGSIVLCQSYSVKQPLDNLVLSNALRMSVIGLAKSLANELGPRGVRVNSINPAWTATDRVTQLLKDRAQRAGTTPQTESDRVTSEIPLRRMGSLEEFGATVAWLASPAASFVHGHALMFDGGATRTPL
jgi:3-oxoacyl-[acyl-carrier protein] reductase